MNKYVNILSVLISNIVTICKNDPHKRSLGSSINVKSVNDSKKFQNHCRRAIHLVLTYLQLIRAHRLLRYMFIGRF